MARRKPDGGTERDRYNWRYRRRSFVCRNMGQASPEVGEVNQYA